MQELCFNEVEMVDGGMNAVDAFLLGAGAGGFAGGFVGALPGAAAGALIGGAIGVGLYYL
ncbi:hypothetical protein [Pseudoxanthomonas spadix]|uniref:hypothetical protein n=1 Tax=Pseudoxanthomonas spadix TaxID=415229 RepID=UPI000EFE22C1|nr:hypothetical protein [Pseudoxanthomonas spadix]MBP3975830.1 hypothetical protein [Pseudoxanthomonas spadix]RMW92981.1 hypothetical protein D9R12_12305 [Pseudoxanthomonas spadix]